MSSATYEPQASHARRARGAQAGLLYEEVVAEVGLRNVGAIHNCEGSDAWRKAAECEHRCLQSGAVAGALPRAWEDEILQRFCAAAGAIDQAHSALLHAHLAVLAPQAQLAIIALLFLRRRRHASTRDASAPAATAPGRTPPSRGSGRQDLLLFVGGAAAGCRS
eukprot:scaffold16996_cov101-Isochrysis_galbana.AAC.1